ncbi:MAG: transglycosylase domain-containing protein, partial [bacterium]|nr:transglycosylase domain-containing protein [bacterium]
MILKRFREKHRWLWRIALAISAFFLFIFGAWIIAPYCVEDPLPRLLSRKPACIYTDIHGVPIYAHSGYDAQWRFDVSLDEVSKDTIQVMLIAEDADFYKHNGVDYTAVLRAFWQNITSASIVSGASTISMQVASLSTGRERSLWGKFLQAARARKMERLHSKEEILTAYLNHTPYGGKITGIEAAARYYFNTSAKDLTFAETTLLCGIPQRPNALRLDRHFEAARKRQQRLLHMMVRKDILSRDEAISIYEHAGVRCRDYSQPASFQRIAKCDENYHAIKANYPIRIDWQQHVLHLLRQQRNHLPHVNDAACVVLDRNAPDRPIIYIGTLDFSNPKDGQVDAARAIRSAGSILKPFFYATAIQGGSLAPNTLLLDAPIRYKDYAPTNYDGTYQGWVSAQTALADSLNTPVIRLFHSIGEEHITETFKALKLPLGERPGLTFALGTGGTTLLDIVNAYHSIGDVFSPETETLIAMMLRRHLPHTPLDVAWKTGTANNNTDAWCVGWTPDYVVGVWFGNKDGHRSDALVGVEIAAPMVGEVFNLLYTHHHPPFWTEPSTITQLCKKTGLRAAPHCKERFNGFTHPSIPLLQCQCHLPSSPSTPLILSPLAATYR